MDKLSRYGDRVLESPTGQMPRGVLSGLNSRTAVYVIRTYGGQGGASPRGEPLSQSATDMKWAACPCRVQK